MLLISPWPVRLSNTESEDGLNVAARKIARRRSSLRAIPIGKLLHQVDRKQYEIVADNSILQLDNLALSSLLTASARQHNTIFCLHVLKKCAPYTIATDFDRWFRHEREFFCFLLEYEFHNERCSSL